MIRLPPRSTRTSTLCPSTTRCRSELAFVLVALEQRNVAVLVELHLLGVARRQRLHEVLGRLVAFLAVDQNLFHVARVKIADGALDEVGFLVDQRRRS